MFVAAVTSGILWNFPFFPLSLNINQSSSVFAFNEFSKFVSNAIIIIEHPCVLLSIYEQTASSKPFPIFRIDDFSKQLSMQNPSIATPSKAGSLVEIKLPAAPLRGTRSLDFPWYPLYKIRFLSVRRRGVTVSPQLPIKPSRYISRDVVC